MHRGCGQSLSSLPSCWQMTLSCSFLVSICMCKSECFVHSGTVWRSEVGNQSLPFLSLLCPEWVSSSKVVGAWPEEKTFFRAAMLLVETAETKTVYTRDCCKYRRNIFFIFQKTRIISAEFHHINMQQWGLLWAGRIWKSRVKSKIHFPSTFIYFKWLAVSSFKCGILSLDCKKRSPFFVTLPSCLVLLKRQGREQCCPAWSPGFWWESSVWPVHIVFPDSPQITFPPSFNSPLFIITLRKAWRFRKDFSDCFCICTTMDMGTSAKSVSHAWGRFCTDISRGNSCSTELR